MNLAACSRPHIAAELEVLDLDVRADRITGYFFDDVSAGSSKRRIRARFLERHLDFECIDSSDFVRAQDFEIGMRIVRSEVVIRFVLVYPFVAHSDRCSGENNRIRDGNPCLRLCTVRIDRFVTDESSGRRDRVGFGSLAQVFFGAFHPIEGDFRKFCFALAGDVAVGSNFGDSLILDLFEVDRDLLTARFDA